MARIGIKEGVKLYGLSPELLLGIMVVSGHYETLKVPMIITSLNDSGTSHRGNSLHAMGQAADIRSKNLPLDQDQKKHLVQAISYDLGDNYDIILEAAGTPNEHLHIEYQPHRAAL